MKKHIFFIAAAFLALFASCSNDEITISKTVNFTVDPSTVIEPFSAVEFNTGELESFNTDFKLRIRLFVYDSKGTLVERALGEYTNYAIQMKSYSFLQEGNYTAVAISDIYRPNNYFEYWTVSGEEKLSTLKISDTGYFGYEKSVLGVTKKSFYVQGGNQDVKINIQPAGALFLVYYRNIFTYSGVTSYELNVNRIQESLSFDSNGDFTVNSKNNNGKFDWRIDALDLEDWDQSTTKNVYSYAYQLPMKNVGLCFSYFSNGKGYLLGNGKTFNLEAGDGYFCVLELKDDTDGEVHTYYEKIAGTSSARMNSMELSKCVKLNCNQDVKRYDRTVGQYLYVKDID